MPGFTSLPHQYFVWVPARAAYSHSLSLGRRYALPVVLESQAANFCASVQLTLSIGMASSSRVGAASQPPAATQAFHSATVTGYLPIRNGRRVTRWVGCSEASSLLPITNSPPVSATMSGSRNAAGGGARAGGLGGSMTAVRGGSSALGAGGLGGKAK